MLALGWLYRWGCARTVALQLTLLSLALANLGLVGLAIDYLNQMVNPDARQPRWPLGWRPPESWTPGMVVALVAAGILGFAACRAVVAYFSEVTKARLIQDIVMHLRARVYNKLQRLSFRFFDANETGSIINRVTGDVQNVRMFVDGVIIQLVNVVLTLGIYIVYMANIHARLTFWCLASTPLLMIIAVAFSRIVKPAYRRNRKLFDKMILTLSENVQGVHVVKGFAREEEEIAKFAADNRTVRDQQWWIFNMVSTFSPIMGLLTQINIVILLGYGGYLYIHDQINVGQGLVVFAVLLRQFSDQVANTANIANSIQQSLIGATRVFEVLDAPVEITSKPDASPCPRLAGKVTFENVTFGYNPDDPVLHDVSFEVQPGMIVAIVGATGSGKSTLMSLIPRFYDPGRGRVLIDDVDVRDLDLDGLRRNVGMVFQESFLFSNTVAANIAFGHPEASREQIEKAARIAAAHDFIGELKKGYDSFIGERGSDLSGGQRQRLAIARAVLLEPSILLLDDPTAAIDPQTEHEIMQAMESAMRHRTTFVVAHRLSTLRRADLVVVLDQGRIVQMGSHDQLMRAGGHYRRAAKLQIADAESLELLGMTAEENSR